VLILGTTGATCARVLSRRVRRQTSLDDQRWSQPSYP